MICPSCGASDVIAVSVSTDDVDLECFVCPNRFTLPIPLPVLAEVRQLGQRLVAHENAATNRRIDDEMPPVEADRLRGLAATAVSATRFEITEMLR